MHSVAYWYPTEPTPAHKKAAYDFFTSLKELLPCGGCREHYTELLGRFPLDRAVDNRMKLLKWTVDVHNEVNISIGKSSIPFEKAVMMIERENSGQIQKHGSSGVVGIGMLFFGVFVGIVLSRGQVQENKYSQKKSGVEVSRSA